MLRWLALGGLWLGGLAGAALGQRPIPVAQLDGSKFLGIWFEMAHLPDRPEKKCVANALMMFAARYKSGQFQIVDSCKLKDDSENVRNRTGRRADPKGDGRLKVTTFWPFYARYWIVGIDADYGWALLGTPNRKQLRVLSKTASLPADELAKAEAIAAAQGFKTGKLVAVPQRP